MIDQSIRCRKILLQKSVGRRKYEPDVEEEYQEGVTIIFEFALEVF